MAFLERNANRGSVSTGPHEIDNSLKFEADNSEYLKWTDISTYATSARKKTFSFSVWFKITELGVQRTIWATAANGYLLLQADGQLKWQQSYGGVVKTLNTNRLFRDTSAWYNVIIAVDTTQSTEANRTRLYVNGVEETSLTSTTYPSQNAEAENVYENHHSLGAYNSSSIFWSGYMADVAFISDAQITPSDVGEFDSDTGIWIPKAYSGGSAPSYFLEFKDSSDLGTATGLDADTLNNIAAADQSTDTPTNNFAVMNINSRTNSDITTIHGGTKVSNSGSSICSMNATIGVSKGKWYWECRFANDPGNTNTVFVGVAAGNDPYVPHNSNNYLGQQSGYGSIGWYFVNGGIYNGTGTWSGPGYGNIIMVALDMDNLKLYFGKEGSWENSSNPANGTSGIDIATSFTSLLNGTDTILPSIAIGAGDYMDSMNFGGYANYTQSSAANDANGYGTFEYAPPSGYYALCTKNLSEFGG